MPGSCARPRGSRLPCATPREEPGADPEARTLRESSSGRWRAGGRSRMNKVSYGFFSFTEITDPTAHAAYNAWHQLDHLPEQYPLTGIVYGQRWVSTPACRAAPRRQRVRARPDPLRHVLLDVGAHPADARRLLRPRRRTAPARPVLRPRGVRCSRGRSAHTTRSRRRGCSSRPRPFRTVHTAVCTWSSKDRPRAT